METLSEQLRELPPSAKDPLFRRLMAEDGLAYLREKNTIVGFEVVLDRPQTLSGFTMIAIQKHTIYAYRSDLHEKPRLVLFPPLDKLFDPAFNLLGLFVVKKQFSDCGFTGTVLKTGILRDMVRDLTPPEKQVDLSDHMVMEMTEHMKHIQSGEQVVHLEEPAEEIPVKVTREQVVTEEPPAETFTETPPEEDSLNRGFDEEDAYAGFEESGYGYDAGYGYEGGYGYDTGYGSEGGYEDPAPETPPEPEEDERTKRLKAQTFESLSDVADYCSAQLGVSRPLAVNVVNKALQSDVAPQYRILLAVKLFSKLFDEKRI